MKNRVEAKARKLTVAATLLLAMVLGMALLAPVAFATNPTLDGVASVNGNPSAATLTVNHGNANPTDIVDMDTIKDDINEVLTDAGIPSANIANFVVNTDQVRLIAQALVDTESFFDAFSNANVTVNVTGDLAAADAQYVLDAVGNEAAAIFPGLTMNLSGTADLSSVTNTSTLPNGFMNLTAADIIAPEGVDLATWTAPLGLSTGQIITQGDKTYEVEADGSIVEIDEAEVPAKTGIR
jgi:hypothetical protein